VRNIATVRQGKINAENALGRLARNACAEKTAQHEVATYRPCEQYGCNSEAAANSRTYSGGMPRQNAAACP
jgi:hypothetical protein